MSYATGVVIRSTLLLPLLELPACGLFIAVSENVQVVLQARRKSMRLILGGQWDALVWENPDICFVRPPALRG
jgi:hypothetical protein